MKKTCKLFILSVSSIVFALGSLSYAIADTIKPDQFVFEDGSHTDSTGTIEMQYGSHTAIFDASDIKNIGEEVTDGRNAVANQMNTVAGANTAVKTGGGATFYTFSDLVNGVNNTYKNGRLKTFYDLADTKGGEYANLSSVTDPDTAFTTLLSDIEADKVAYAENLPPETIIQYGYYAIDLHEYGVAATYNTIGAYADIPTDYRFGRRTAYTFTYNIRTLCRFYGIDYTQLTAEDFVTGYKNIDTNRIGTTSTQPDWAYVFTGTITADYDSTNGVLTLSNIYSGCLTANNGEGNYRISNAEFTSDDIICMLVPRSVIVD